MEDENKSNEEFEEEEYDENIDNNFGGTRNCQTEEIQVTEGNYDYQNGDENNNE